MNCFFVSLLLPCFFIFFRFLHLFQFFLSVRSILSLYYLLWWCHTPLLHSFSSFFFCNCSQFQFILLCIILRFSSHFLSSATNPQFSIAHPSSNSLPNHFSNFSFKFSLPILNSLTIILLFSLFSLIFFSRFSIFSVSFFLPFFFLFLFFFDLVLKTTNSK